jgi:hypothetical protein
VTSRYTWSQLRPILPRQDEGPGVSLLLLLLPSRSFICLTNPVRAKRKKIVDGCAKTGHVSVRTSVARNQLAMCSFWTTPNATTKIGRTATPSPPRRVVARLAISRLAWSLVVVFSAAAFLRPAGAVKLDFEGVGNDNLVGNFYNGGGGGPSKNYGITFGTSARGAVDDEAGGNFGLANEPSPNTTLVLGRNESQAFLTVLGGFTRLSFQYATVNTMTATVYDGPDRTGVVLGNLTLLPTGICTDCGDPTGNFGIWFNVTVPFAGVAKSAGFSTSDDAYIHVDDLRVRLTSETDPPTTAPTRSPTAPPTPAPTASPTRAPSKRPTKGPTVRPRTRSPTRAPGLTSACPRKKMKGNNMCRMKNMMTMKRKARKAA